MILFAFELYLKNCINLNAKCKCNPNQIIPLHFTKVFEHASANSKEDHVMCVMWQCYTAIIWEHIIRYSSLIEVVSLQLVQQI